MKSISTAQVFGDCHPHLASHNQELEAQAEANSKYESYKMIVTL